MDSFVIVFSNDILVYPKSREERASLFALFWVFWKKSSCMKSSQNMSSGCIHCLSREYGFKNEGDSGSPEDRGS